MNTSESRLGSRIRSTWLYRKFSSINTSLLFLGIVCFVYVVGTIFPQGESFERYEEAGGRFLALVKHLGLLNLFQSPLFLFAVMLFGLNLVVCTYHRWFALRRARTSTSFSKESLLSRPQGRSVELTGCTDGERKLTSVIAALGFRIRQQDHPGPTQWRFVAEKGLNYRWLSWCYHLLMVVCLGAFICSFLFSFEGDVTIFPEASGARGTDGTDMSAADAPPTSVSAARTAVSVETTSRETRWHKLLNRLRLAGEEPQTSPEHPIEIVLEQFIVEQTQFPVLKYPKDFRGRFAAVAGWGEKLSYTVSDDSYYPKDWKSVLRVYRNGELAKEKTIEVNTPLYYAGLTFYQMGYDQIFDLVLDDGTVIEALAPNEKFQVQGIPGRLVAGTFKTGKWFKKDGTVEEIIPFATLKHIPEATVQQSGSEPGEDVSRKERGTVVGKLMQGQPLTVNGRTLTMRDFHQGTVLSYRHDPGVPVLYVASSILLAIMLLRVWGYWYRLRCVVDTHEGRSTAAFELQSRGLLADDTKMSDRLSESVSVPE